jgi:hypothetical protein
MSAKKDEDDRPAEWLSQVIVRAPAGRGHAITVSRDRVLVPKKKMKKRGFYPLHFSGRGQNAVSIGIFPGKRYPMLFPENITLGPDEIERGLAAFLFLYIYNYGKINTISGKIPWVVRKGFRRSITMEYNNILKRYKRWKDKH